MPQSVIIPFLTALGIPKAGLAIAYNLLASTALNLAAAALSRPKGADQSRELSTPRSLPPYRFVYGKVTRTAGSWAPGWVVKSGVLYGCLILNSRPSAGTNLKVFLDKREIELLGDVQDFGNVQQGTVTVAEGETQATVTHGLGATPSASQVGASFGQELAVIDNITSTTFRVTIPDPAPVGGTVVKWSGALPGGGAEANTSPLTGYAKFWLGLGDQGHPPADILLEMGDFAGLATSFFWASDKWSGRTVMWVRFAKGSASSAQERWPSAPPAVDVEMDWSLVWDCNDEAQDPDDPATWEVSDNQALCLLDALRTNPLAIYRDDAIWLETLAYAAEVADEAVPVKAGGTEPRYRVGGVLVFNGQAELLDQIQPLAQAGGGSLIKVGGRIGYRVGIYQEPVVTLTDYLRDAPIRFQQTRRQRDLPNAIKAVFPDPASQWESSELIPYPIRADWDGGDDRVQVLDLPLVPFARQAMRLQKIEGERRKLSKALSAVFLPEEAIEAVSGATAEVAFPEADRRNGEYRVTQMHPAQWLEQDDGVALAMPMDLAEESEAIYAWTAETDEQDRINQAFTPIDLSLPPPTDLTAEVVDAELRMEWQAPGQLLTDPNPLFIPDDSVAGFLWEWRRNQGAWQQGGTPSMSLANLSTGIVTATLFSLITDSSYDLRVQSTAEGRTSTAIYAGPYQVGFELGAPTGVSALADTDQITIDATSPDDADHSALQYWGADTDDEHAAELLAEQVVAQNTADSFTETGLATGVTRYYFVRSVTATGAVGPFAASVTATTSPVFEASVYESGVYL